MACDVMRVHPRPCWLRVPEVASDTPGELVVGSSRPVAAGRRCPMRSVASSRIRGQAPGPLQGGEGLVDVGMHLRHAGEAGGISIITLLRSTATGSSSPASVVNPSRCASSVMAPPPATASRIGGPSANHRSISARAAASTAAEPTTAASVEGCPCRIDFSRAVSVAIAASSSATSINFGLSSTTRSRKSRYPRIGML